MPVIVTTSHYSSRLAAELVARVGTRARVVRGTCLSYGDDITYWAVGQIVRELMSALAQAGVTSDVYTRFQSLEDRVIDSGGPGFPLPVDAVSWKAAADLGNAHAAFEMSVLYGTGSGWRDPNRTTAYKSDLFIVDWTNGNSNQLTLPHGVDRIEEMGADAVVVGTDGDLASTLDTSSDLVDQLQSNIVWGMRGNFLSISSTITSAVDDCEDVVDPLFGTSRRVIPTTTTAGSITGTLNR